METGLHLLTKDGAIRVAFSPRLTTEQYGELMLVVEADRTPSKEELCNALQAIAWDWGNSIEIEDGAPEYVRAR